jgi:ABC-type transporter Mla maintaining outer membrane lipid asymmetry ATPase subunit MlaF
MGILLLFIPVGYQTGRFASFITGKKYIIMTIRKASQRNPSGLHRPAETNVTPKKLRCRRLLLPSEPSHGMEKRSALAANG